jgi:hypothetical protein
VAAHGKYGGVEEGIPPSQQWGWIPRLPWWWWRTSTAGLVASLSHVVKIFAGVGGKVDVGLSGMGFGLAQRSASGENHRSSDQSMVMLTSFPAARRNSASPKNKRKRELEKKTVLLQKRKENES